MASPNRAALEDELLAILRPALPGLDEVDSLPTPKDLDAKIPNLRTASCFLAFVGGAAAEPAALSLHSQRLDWVWSMVVLARNYRSPQERGRSALDVLDAAIAALVGAQTSAGAVRLVREQLMELPESWVGIVGYEAQVSVAPYFRK